MYRIVTGKITERFEYPVSHRPNQTSRGPQADFLSAIALHLLCFRVGMESPSRRASTTTPPKGHRATFRPFFPFWSPVVAEMSRSCRGVVAQCRAVVAQLSRSLSRRCRGAVFFRKLVFLTISAVFPPKNLISTPSTTKLDIGVCPVAARVADGVTTVIATTPRRAGPSRALAGCALGISMGRRVSWGNCT